MAKNNDNRRPHLFPAETSTTERFRTPASGGGGGPNVPGRLRGVHGPMLLGQLQTLHAVAADRADEYDEAELESGVGLQIEFETFADAELLASRLADERRHIELSNVRVRADGSVRATVWVPQGALVVFENKIRDYMAEKRSNAGKALWTFAH